MERLREIEHFSLKKKRLINVCKYLKGGHRGDGFSLFSVVPSDRIKCNGHEPHKQKRLCLIISKHCEGHRTLAEAAQTGSRVSLFGDI